MAGAACGSGNSYSSGAPLVFIVVYVVLSFVFLFVMQLSCLLDFEF